MILINWTPSRHAGRLVQILSRRETPFLVRIFKTFDRVTLKRLESVQKLSASRLNRLESVQHFRVTPEAPRKRLTLECLAHYVLTTLRSCLAGYNQFYTTHLSQNVLEWQSHGPFDPQPTGHHSTILRADRWPRCSPLHQGHFHSSRSSYWWSVDWNYASALTNERLSSN